MRHLDLLYNTELHENPDLLLSLIQRQSPPRSDRDLIEKIGPNRSSQFRAQTEYIQLMADRPNQQTQTKLIKSIPATKINKTNKQTKQQNKTKNKLTNKKKFTNPWSNITNYIHALSGITIHNIYKLFTKCT